MKTGLIIATFVGGAVLAGSGGFYWGLIFADHTLTEGARYVYASKQMPPYQPLDVGNKDAFPESSPWRTAYGQARTYCQLVEKANVGALRNECNPWLERGPHMYKIEINR